MRGQWPSVISGAISERQWEECKTVAELHRVIKVWQGNRYTAYYFTPTLATWLYQLDMVLAYSIQLQGGGVGGGELCLVFLWQSNSDHWSSHWGGAGPVLVIFELFIKFNWELQLNSVLVVPGAQNTIVNLAQWEDTTECTFSKLGIPVCKNIVNKYSHDSQWRRSRCNNDLLTGTGME